MHIVHLFDFDLGSRYPVMLSQGLLELARTRKNVTVAFNHPVHSLGRVLAEPAEDIEGELLKATFIICAGNEHFKQPKINRLLGWHNLWPRVAYMDFSDGLNLHNKPMQKCLAYVKRTGGTSGKRLELGYNLLDQYSVVPHQDRDIDVVYLFDHHPGLRDEPDRNVVGRQRVYEALEAANLDNTHLGRLHEQSTRMWRCILEPREENPLIEYLRYLRRAKIVFTIQPDHGGGDFRLWEAFASGALVICDKPRLERHPFVPYKHYIPVDPLDKTSVEDVIGSIPILLENDALRDSVALKGWTHARTYHRAVHRVTTLIEHLEGLRT